jgi:alkylated DNA repair dioxygenase AlkB
MSSQLGLFGAEDRPPAHLPDGFRYAPDLISADEERTLVREIERLPFREFQFQGYVGKRRVVSFGWRYDFNEGALHEAGDLPPFLLPLRDAAARFAGLPPEHLPHALVTEYAAGAGIGWHRDKGVFDEVIGVSLVSPCVFRLRRKVGDGWERVSVTAEPRSAYLLTGAARTEWEHSIPEVDTLRYSVTFRSLRAP